MGWQATKISDVVMKHSEYEANGCPKCSGLIGSGLISGRGATVWQCKCGFVYHVINDNLDKSPFAVNENAVEFAIH